MSSRSLRPGLPIETVYNPQLYSHRQVVRAGLVAQTLDRGRFVLVEPPERLPGVGERSS
jgi:hypothetical protein